MLKKPREKGRRLELKVAKLIREKLKIKAARSPYSGATDFEKSDIYAPLLGWQLEVKNQEKVKLWEWWNKIKNRKKPALIISGNYRPILIVLNFEDFLDLIKKINRL